MPNPPGLLTYSITAPVLYGALLAMVPLDLFLVLYQAVCFGAWGIPKVYRKDHFQYDRARLPYLTWRQRLHCVYCSYANGLASYFREILGRTEQYWCPIRHSQPPASPHSRYSHFIPFDDAEAFRKSSDAVANDFSDLDD